MESEAIQDGYASIENASSAELEAESNNVDSLEVVSSGGDTTRELVSESLTRAELELACCTEKLVNLDKLVMHVASRENDFEAFSLEEESTLEGSVVKALEFDLLYGFLDSEVKEQEIILSTLQTEVADSGDIISSFKHLGGSITEMEEKLQDCDESLKLSFEQLSDIKLQCATFQRILSGSSTDEKWKENKDLSGLEDHGILNLNEKIKMHTEEQQRHVLRLLEKSLAREMDLEKKLTESSQTEENLKLSLQQEILFIEEEAEDIWERLFKAENSAEILTGILKEFSRQIQMAQFNMNEPTEREEDFKSKIQDLNEQLKGKDSALLESERFKTELVTKVNLLKRDLERVQQLERQLKDSEIKRLHAEVSAEASQEKLTMLDCTIVDMENLIKDLKLKVFKAESQTDSAEEKCIILSEANAELVEEINFLRDKMKSLDASLLQADEAKKATAKDIKIRTQFIMDLIMQLALEREHIHKQISSLKEKKKTRVKYLQQINKKPSVTVAGSHGAKINNVSRDSSKNNIKTVRADSSSINAITVRNIDAGQFQVRHVVVMAVLIGVIYTFSMLWIFQM